MTHDEMIEGSHFLDADDAAESEDTNPRGRSSDGPADRL